MQTILMSIHPKWCEKIFNGEKTIEVRKSAPKPPLKVVVYCTKSMTHLYRYDKCIDENEQLFTVDYNKHSLMISNEFNGKVIGEFICDRVYIVYNPRVGWVDVVDCQRSQLSAKEMFKYGGNKPLYGLHITSQKIYDKPKELGEFYSIKQCKPLARPPQSYMRIQDPKAV
jgi:predicted transcriptional regulator